MKFKSPNENTVHVAALNGRVACVGQEWIEIHPSLHALAISKGCITDNMTDESIAAREPVVDHSFAPNYETRLREVLQEIHDSGTDQDITSKGVPNMRALNRRTGFSCDLSDVLRIWQEITGKDAARVAKAA